MKKLLIVAILALSATLFTACATKTQPLDTAPKGDSTIAFIDLDTFDISMTRDLQREADLVVVRFPNQPVMVNEMPERLQKWLSAVHEHGQGLTVESKEGYVQKDIMSLVGVLVAGYKLVKNNMPAIVGRKYKAIITMANSNGVIEKVEFIRF